jgi:hypothetical protein
LSCGCDLEFLEEWITGYIKFFLFFKKNLYPMI